MYMLLKLFIHTKNAVTQYSKLYDFIFRIKRSCISVTVGANLLDRAILSYPLVILLLIDETIL